MYDNDDQRQALGQPSLNIFMLKMIVVHKFFIIIFYPQKKHLLYICPSSIFHLCNMLCMIMFCPVMPISFDV